MAGRQGTQKAQVHTVFKNRLEALREDAGKIQKSFRGSGQRIWQVPPEITSLLDIAKLHEPAWNRDEINDNYAECFADPEDSGTTGDVISLKLQLDYVAVEERAFRTRHATICRAMCHAMGRRRGHDRGRVFRNIEAQATDAIAAGAGGSG